MQVSDDSGHINNDTMTDAGPSHLVSSHTGNGATVANDSDENSVTQELPLSLSNPPFHRRSRVLLPTPLHGYDREARHSDRGISAGRGHGGYHGARRHSYHGGSIHRGGSSHRGRGRPTTDDHIGASGDAGAGASGYGEAHGYTASGRYSGRARGRWRGRGRGRGRARMHPYPSSVVSNIYQKD